MNRAIALIVLLILMGWCVFEGTLWSASPSQVSSRPAENTPVVTIPFEFVKGHILITLEINNSGPHTFDLDSGSNVIFLNLPSAREAGLQLLPMKNGTYGEGVEGKVSIPWAASISLYKGHTPLFAGNVLVFDFPLCASRAGRIPDGILGLPLFVSFVVEIDFANHLLRLYDPRTYEYRGRGDILPLRVADHVPYVEARIELLDGKTAKAKLMVDSGAEEALTLNQPFQLKYGLPGAQATVSVEKCGIEGTFHAERGYVKTLQLDHILMEKPGTVFSAATQGFVARRTIDGTIGSAILEHFKVIFDFSRKRMIWEPIGP